MGGFGSSQYLKSCIEKQYPHIQVLQPNDAWAAIVKLVNPKRFKAQEAMSNHSISRGAALSKLPRQAVVTSTCATKHYGVTAWSTHDPLVDVGVPICVPLLDGKERSERVSVQDPTVVPNIINDLD